MKIQALKELRRVNSFSQLEFAKYLRCSCSFYRQIENGKRQPSINFLVKLKTLFPRFDINMVVNELISKKLDGEIREHIEEDYEKYR